MRNFIYVSANKAINLNKVEVMERIDSPTNPASIAFWVSSKKYIMQFNSKIDRDEFFKTILKNEEKD